MLPFDLFMLRRERHFSSYDECPKIYYRFNSKGDYGPQKLDRLVSYFADRAGEAIDGRFADETRWRPISYFLDLWQRIPPGANTIERLNREGIKVQGDITEFRGRKLIRERQRAKPPSRRQIEQLRNFGAEPENIISRGQAEVLIHEHQKALQKQEQENAAAQQRLEDAPKMEACNKRLQELEVRVNDILPGWAPEKFNDLESLLVYTDLIEEALDYATRFDLTELYGGPFFDPAESADYYLEFSKDPTAAEVRTFQADIFVNYLSAKGEQFDHLTPLKHAFPSVKISPL